METVLKDLQNFSNSNHSRCSENEYHANIARLEEWSKKYYAGEPAVSDPLYDAVYAHTLRLGKSLGIVPAPNSVLTRPGYILDSSSATYRHITPMYSLANIFQWDFAQSAMNMWGNPEAVVEYKFDGLAASLVYIDGKLSLGSTRGDGEVGEIFNLAVIYDAPQTIPLKGIVEIRGELIMPVDPEHRDPTKSLRNIAAGHVRRLIPESGVLAFIAYGMGDPLSNGINTCGELNGRLANWGFMVTRLFSFNPDESILTSNHDRLAWIDHYRYEDCDEIITRNRFEIDGLVIKVNDFKWQEKIGHTAKVPKHSLAFKFASLGEITHFSNIVWQVGRTGVITPVGEFPPLRIGGVEVTRATLHNLKFVMDNRVAPGAMTNIVRSGDVIPYVESVLSSETPTYPVLCPCCQTPTIPQEVFLICPNQKCPDRVRQHLEFVYGRDCLDIDGLGPSTIAELYNIAALRNVWDIFRIPKLKNVILAAGILGDKSFSNLVRAIEKSKNVRFEIAIKCLGIENVGKSIGKKLAVLTNGNIHNLEALTYQELIDVAGIGEITARAILAFVSSNDWKEMKRNFLSELNIHATTAAEAGPLTGMVICITGNHHGYTRESLRDLLISKGATVTNKVTSKTHALICPPGFVSSKLTDAEKYGVTVHSGPHALLNK